ncbi:MAG: DUF5060 domain-containing protein [Planctomycetota bacterium]
MFLISHRTGWCYVACIAAVIGFGLEANAQATVTGPTTQWQTFTLNFEQPGSFSELGGAVNPFLDYRLQVAFTNGDQTYSVPGYYASTENGPGLWRAKFTPDTPGEWTYSVDFRTGANAAVLLDGEVGGAAGVTTTGFHGATGTVNVASRDAGAEGFLSQGRLEYVGGHYLKFRDGGYWIKTGTDSPENLLGYAGFDNTASSNNRGPDYGNAFPQATRYLHRYPDHVQDWNPGDPTWQTDNPAGDEPGAQDGKGLIGALNYLSEAGVNSVYFLPNNIGGDGRETQPYADPNVNNNGSGSNNNVRFDVSKLEQWEIALDHAQRQGIHLHFVLNEAETPNKQELDGGTLGVERKLYYRELVARFGHHNALQWNLSEEYNRTRNGAGELSPDTVKQWAAYLSEVDPYDHPLTVHNGNYGDWPNNTAFPDQHTDLPGPGQRAEWEPFFGDADFDLTSYQNYNERGIGDEVEYLRARSAAMGRPIPIMIDEPESPDGIPLGPGVHNNNAADAMRREMVYDILFSGGGFEWFVRQQDQALEDFREFDQLWRDSATARDFMELHLPFWEMDPDDNLVRGSDTDYGGAEVFAKAGEVYAIYLPDGSTDDNPQSADNSPELDLRGLAGEAFTLRWFDPKAGVFVGEASEITGGGWSAIGASPRGKLNTDDWVILIEVVSDLALGDYNGNGQVEQGDLNLVLNNWGRDTRAGLIPAGWVNTSDLLGVVDQGELNVVLNNWGSSASPDFGNASVPEPMGVASVSVLGMAGLIRRR